MKKISMLTILTISCTQFSYTAQEERTPLIDALEFHEHEEIKRLLSSGSDPDQIIDLNSFDLKLTALDMALSNYMSRHHDHEQAKTSLNLLTSRVIDYTRPDDIFGHIDRWKPARLSLPGFILSQLNFYGTGPELEHNAIQAELISFIENQDRIIEDNLYKFNIPKDVQVVITSYLYKTPKLDLEKEKTKLRGYKNRWQKKQQLVRYGTAGLVALGSAALTYTKLLQ